jgi:hypothetical protein
MSTHLGYKIISGIQLFVIALTAKEINYTITIQAYNLKKELDEINKKLTEGLKQTQTQKQKQVQVQVQQNPFSLTWLCPWPGVATKSSSSKELK